MKKIYMFIILFVGYCLFSIPVKNIDTHEAEHLGTKLVPITIYKIDNKIGILGKDKHFYLFDEYGNKEDKGYYNEVTVDNNVFYGVRNITSIAESNDGRYNFEICNILKKEKIFNIRILPNAINNEKLYFLSYDTEIFFKKNDSFFYSLTRGNLALNRQKSYLMQLNGSDSIPFFYPTFSFNNSHGNLKYCNNKLISKEDDYENRKITKVIINKYEVGEEEIIKTGTNVFSSFLSQENTVIFFICTDKDENYYFMCFYGFNLENRNITGEIFANLEIVKVNSSDEILKRKKYSLSCNYKDYLFDYYDFAALPIAAYYEESTNKVVVFFFKDNKELLYEYF